MNISKVSMMLVIGCSTVHSIKKEFDWNLSHDIAPFSNIKSKKRISKASIKAIDEYLFNQRESISVNDD